LQDPVYWRKSRNGKVKKKLDRAILANNRAAIERYKAESKAIRQRVVRRQRERRYEDHPYTCSIDVRLDDVITLYSPFTNYKLVDTWTRLYGGADPVFPAFSAEDDYKLIERLKTKVIGSTFNLGVFAAEFSEAMHMIFNAANRLQLALKAASKGQWRRAARHLRPAGSASKDVRHFYTKGRTTSANWLELQYGWLPLISDLQEGAKMLAHMTEYPFELKLKVSLSKAGSVVSASPSNTIPLGTAVRRKSIIARLREVDVPQLIGLTDYASIVWERLPYSFVADWAIPIGNYLAARGVAQALKGTFVTTDYRNGFVTGLKLNNNGWYMEDGGPFNHKIIKVDRTVSSSLAVPKPTVRTFDEAFSWRRAANAVALLVLRGSAPKGVLR